jgi:hypothetical protein
LKPKTGLECSAHFVLSLFHEMVVLSFYFAVGV